MKVLNRAAGQMLTIPPPCLLSLHILRPARLPFPLFLPQDTVNALSDFLGFFPLYFITAVVYALRVSVLLQRLIAKLRPRRPPFLSLGLLVPVGGGNGFAFVLPLFRVIDFVPVPVRNVLLFLLRSPLAAFVKRAHSQHDMGVGFPPPVSRDIFFYGFG